MEEYEYLVFLQPTKQMLYFDNEIEAITIRQEALNAQMYCWLIYIKKQI